MNEKEYTIYVTGKITVMAENENLALDEAYEKLNGTGLEFDLDVEEEE